MEFDAAKNSPTQALMWCHTQALLWCSLGRI